MARPVIALLTDFGVRDHYVAAMKGVILGICPDVTLLDITHDIAPQDVMGGALELEAVAPYLPPATIVVGVVDPGVGSTRRGLVVETGGGLRCVGPDNGLFSLVADQATTRVFEIANDRCTRAVISRTFEGRDRFAPVAAWLAAGTVTDAVGPSLSSMHRLTMPAPVIGPSGVDGEVLHIDRFGNLITNVPEDAMPSWRDALVITVDDAHDARLVGTYAESPAGSLCALVGSTGRLEIAVANGSAAASLGLSRGARVRLRRRSAA